MLRMENQQQHVPLKWLEPLNKYNDNDDVLQSYIDLQRKTQHLLYGGGGKDKSPKGFVDAPIQDFVDLINHHCSYTTLSSCSGRISLFDPNHHHHDQYEPSSSMSTTGDVAASPETTTPDDGEAAPTSSVTTNFGKGTTGGWRFVSHYPVEDYQQIWDCFETETSNTEDSADWDISSDTAPWLFQMEPMLLHVGAASLKHGQLLLRIALECGYRESGLVVTDSRVTVAIRSHSLSLSMPLSNNKSHPLYPQSPKFIKALVDQANQRLEQTWKHQYRLYQAVESTLFQWNPPTIIANVSMNSSPDNNEQTSKKNPCTSASPPSLSLWQSATVAIIRDDDYVKSRETRETHKDKNRDRNSSRSPEDVDIWAFGGYGIGPESSSSKKRRRGAQRSSTIYKLERRDNQWESEWHAITPCCPSVDSILSGDVTGDFSVVASLPDGQGMAACHLGDWVVLWGGRQSPTSPLGQTLYLWDYQKLQLLTANYLHGDTPPAPRWGHTMVKATVNGTDCLVIMGGCNDVQVFDDVYILHYYHSNDQEGSNKDDASAGQGRHTFSWEKVSSISLPTPRFHHSSVVVHNNMICMFGGLESVSTVIRPLSFKEEDPKDTNFLWSFCIYETSQHTERGGIRSTKVKAVDFNGNSYLSGATSKMLSLSTLFGASSAVCNQLAPSTSSVYPPLMLITGGVTSVEAGIGIQVTGDGDGEDGNDISPLHCVLIIPGYKNESANISILPVQIVAPADDGGPCDFGSLVHHNCLRVSSNEYICVGGGVSTFAFGNTFAKAFSIRIEIHDEERLETTNRPKSSSAATSTANARGAPPSFDVVGASTQSKSAMTNVVLVAPENAKSVKSFLESRGWLDKGFRMSKVSIASTSSSSQQPQIAVPIVEDARQGISQQFGEIPGEEPAAQTDTDIGAWDFSIILGHDRMEMPFSTARFASKGKRR